MDFNDKPAFRIKMQNIARKVDRKLDEEQCDVFFDDLRDLPIKTIEKALDQALRDRDPEDIFLRRAMITIPEIRQAAEELRKENNPQARLLKMRTNKRLDNRNYKRRKVYRLSM